MNYLHRWTVALSHYGWTGEQGMDVQIKDTQFWLGSRGYSVIRDGVEFYQLTPAQRSTIFTITAYGAPAYEVYCLSFLETRALRIGGRKKASTITHINRAIERLLGTDKYTLEWSNELLRIRIDNEWLPLIRPMRLWNVPIPHSSSVDRQAHNPRPHIETEPEPVVESKLIFSKRHNTLPDKVEKSREGEFSHFLDKEFSDLEVDSLEVDSAY